MPPVLSAMTFGLLAIVLLAAAVCDWRTGKIFNWLTYPAILAGLALATIGGYAVNGPAGAWEGFCGSCLGLAAGFIPMAIIFYSGGLGGGDVRLVAAIGAIGASWEFVLSSVVYSVFFIAVMALGVMLLRGIFWRTLRTVLLALFMTASKVRPVLPSDSPRIPLGVGFCLGGLLAGMETMLRVPMPWSR